MGYRVEYAPIRKVRGAERKISRVSALTGVWLLFFILLVNGFWPRGAMVMRDLLMPVDTAALETLASDLRAGAQLDEAVEGFCREIIADAQLDTY